MDVSKVISPVGWSEQMPDAPASGANRASYCWAWAFCSGVASGSSVMKPSRNSQRRLRKAGVLGSGGSDDSKSVGAASKLRTKFIVTPVTFVGCVPLLCALR
jgi:hypothetical protein